MGRYRAIERVVYSDAYGHTHVLHAGDTTDDPALVASASEAFEDTAKDNEMGPGTSAAEQKGLEPEGSSTIEQGELNRALVDGKEFVGGVLTGTPVPPPVEEGSVSSSGAETGSKEDLEDQARFREAQEGADREAAERNEERIARQSAAAGEQTAAPVETRPEAGHASKVSAKS